MRARLDSAEASLAAGRLDGAVTELMRVVREERANSRAWFLLGRTWVAYASESYGRLLSEVPPDSPYALAVTADGLMRRLQHAHAVAAFRKALAREPGLISAHVAIANIYRSMGRNDWAEKEQAAITAFDCLAHVVECDSIQGRYDAALAALRGRPQTPASLYWRGQAYTGLANQAFAALERLPPSVEFHRYKAGLDWEAGRRVEMVGRLREAVKLVPGDRGLRRDLGMALGAAGFYDEAYTAAAELLRDEPGSPQLNGLAGDALLSSQKAEEAIPFLKKAAAANPPAHASLGRAYMQIGDAKQALPHLKIAVEADTDGSMCHLLARAYRLTGQPELAAAAMKKYQELSAKSAATPPPLDIAPR
jgi:tetratricopeptide (TPR) repeat protein